jgi:hypothetical protein
MVSAVLAFLVAFLNAAFGLCQSWRFYALLLRADVVGRGSPRTA